MCQLKSGIALRDRVFVPDHDDHTRMLEELGIEDSYLNASKTFVRFELLPQSVDLSKPVETWLLSVEQDVTPDWWDADADRARIVEAVEAWAKEHIITEGAREVRNGIYHAVGDSLVTARDNSQVEAWNNSRVVAMDNSRVEAWKNSRVEAWKNSQVAARDNSQVEARNSSIVLWPGEKRIQAPKGYRLEEHG